MNKILFATSLALAGATLSNASALIPNTCYGNCGTASANGVVTAPPGGGTYSFVSTNLGITGGGTLPGGSLGAETNGSTLTSSIFSSGAGSLLEFNFNYVTSDGAGYSDYAWAALINAGDNSLEAMLFTARTRTSGSIVPGFGMPANAATLTPPSVGISSGTNWAQLGASSGTCYASGCGYTGWINSQYTVATAGNYYVAYGVSNWADGFYDSGMAISGTRIGETVVEIPSGDTPEPGTISMLVAGLGATLFGLRRRSA